MGKYFLGIDTSNYKTSLSIIDENRDVVFNKSVFLDVKLGETGLRQAYAFFKHSNRLPEFVEEAFKAVNPKDLNAVGVSYAPRRVEGSYMPCFLAGLNAAREISSALSIPMYQFSHQEGHISSAVDVNSDKDKFIFCHFSGGTSEILLCEEDANGYTSDIIGGTRDISIGQLLDRVGVKLGFAFPSGKYLDEMAYSNIVNSKLLPKIKIEDGYFNLSGIETKVKKHIEQLQEIEIEQSIESLDSCKSNIAYLTNIHDMQYLASELFDKIAQLIYEDLLYLSAKYSVNTINLAGGVCASKTLRFNIENLIKKDTSDNRTNTFAEFPEFIFGDAELCGDNAIGIAKLCRRLYINE